MTDSGWSIRFFEANDYSDDATIDFYSNFKKSKSRQLDTIVTFSGMYGIDNYLVWNMHKDLPVYDFSTVALDVNIFMYKSTGIVSFQDFYRVRDVRYNPKKSQYTLYAVSESTVRLQSKLINYNVKSLSYDEKRTAKEILIEVLQGNDIFYVVFHDETEATKNMTNYEYKYFDIDPEWSVLDFIEYIADDNKYEWCIDTFVGEATNKPYWILHIGHELKGDLDMNATKPLNIETDNISESLYSMKITTNSSPMQPLATWKEEYKCVWAKHTAGKGGGTSRGCFVPTGIANFDKNLYLSTLEGEIERHIGYSMLNRRKVRIPSITIGNILKDLGNEYVDEVSIQKNPKIRSVREPHNILIDRGDDLAVQHQLEKATRSSPYLDHESGLLFPSPKLDHPPPNSLIFNVGGKRESAVVGGYVYGDGRTEEDGVKTLNIPIKEKEDFRLRFPDGAEIFYDASKQIWITQSTLGWVFKGATITDPDDEPVKSRLTQEQNMFQIYGGNLMWDTQTLHMHMMDGGCFQVVPKTGPQPDDPYRRYAITCDNESGEVVIEAKDDIEIIIKYKGEVSDGTITVNTTGTVNIGNDATVIRLAGGGSKISHGDHKHITGNMGIPVPAHPASDGSDITEVD